MLDIPPLRAASKLLLRLRRTGLALAALTALTGYVWLLRYGVHLAYPTQWPHLQPDQQADLANKFQTLLIQAAGALGAGVAVWFTTRTYRLSRRGQDTDRFVKALEQLGSPEPYLRLGGVHVLEQVLRDAPDHHNAILEVLVTFIHQRTPAAQPPDQSEPLPAAPAPDVQVALTALSRRPHRPELELRPLGLHGLHLAHAHIFGDLTRAYLRSADLTDAHLHGVNLTGADLRSAVLTRIDLRGANLAGANLLGADLTGANLFAAHLTDAYLRSADLTDASLHGSNLTRANLHGSNLTRADLRSAYFRSAVLTGANLRSADLTGADLRGANLAGANLLGADLTGTKVPSDLVLPDGWELLSDGWERNPETGRAIRGAHRRSGSPQHGGAPGAEKAGSGPA